MGYVENKSDKMDAFQKIKMILDEQTATILELTAQKPMTASQIGRKLNMPHSVCYRKLKMLIDANLISEISAANHQFGYAGAKQYFCNIDRAYVALEQGELKCVLKLRNQDELQTYRMSREI